MKLELKAFQEARVAELVREMRLAAVEAHSGKNQAVVLSSPTGSGKTVMATAAIETLIAGDDEAPPNAQAAFLWLSDQPELNEQTRRKMLASSSILTSSRLQVVSSSFNREHFQPGRVYFLNTQKLSRTSLLVKEGDKHPVTLWQTIANMVADCPTDFYIVIDEAHRGMVESRNQRAEAQSIVQRFIKGSPGEMPPVPLVLGISATPGRFDEVIRGTGRTMRSVDVSPEEVRESGLLKQVITLYRPAVSAPSDVTLLRAAARSWRDYKVRWQQYCVRESRSSVRPILVVQVTDGTAKQISTTDIAEAIDAIQDEVGSLPDASFGHSFQEGHELTVGSHTLRYVAPSDIEPDVSLHVIFFKTSLNTGWDCPRAEVMMSFRTAMDATAIAQLVGRMVRAPLARPVGTDSLLNTVALYLPHYDKGGVNAIIDRLSKADPDGSPPVEYEDGDDTIELHPAADLAECFATYKSLPSYVIPRTRKTTEVRRLMKLARLLANDEFDPDALDSAQEAVVEVLIRSQERLADDETFAAVVAGSRNLKVLAAEWTFGEGAPVEDIIDVEVSQENLDDMLEAAGRKLGDGLQTLYWKARCDHDRKLINQAKLEAYALANRRDVVQAVEAAANKLVQSWLKAHHKAISALNDSDRQAYLEIYRLASTPELLPELVPPPSDRAKRSDETWMRHLYVDEQGHFPARFNKWETPTLNEELDSTLELVGWLRNKPRADWAVCVPFKISGEVKPCYPDFVVFRRAGDHLTASIIDPHSIHLPDAPAKAVGLAEYAAKHSMDYAGIELVIVDDGATIRLDLTDEAVRQSVLKVETREHLKLLFALAADA
jgi:type III restriction enzyme